MCSDLSLLPQRGAFEAGAAQCVAVAPVEPVQVRL